MLFFTEWEKINLTMTTMTHRWRKRHNKVTAIVDLKTNEIAYNSIIHLH